MNSDTLLVFPFFKLMLISVVFTFQNFIFELWPGKNGIVTVHTHTHMLLQACVHMCVTCINFSICESLLVLDRNIAISAVISFIR
jgi:hypothetical protein